MAAQLGGGEQGGGGARRERVVGTEVRSDPQGTSPLSKARALGRLGGSDPSSRALLEVEQLGRARVGGGGGRGGREGPGLCPRH